MGKYNNFTAEVTLNKSGLRDPEINAFLAVFDDLLSHLGLTYAQGTFSLCSQKYGEPVLQRINVDLHGRSYDRISVYNSIHEIVNWPTYSSDFCERVVRFTRRKGQSCPRSGLYRDDKLIAIVVNAACGRFIASLKMQSGGVELSIEAEEILRALAVAISRLSPGDRFLQQNLANYIVQEDAPPCRYVRKLFKRYDLSALCAWKKWYDSQKQPHYLLDSASPTPAQPDSPMSEKEES